MKYADARELLTELNETDECHTLEAKECSKVDQAVLETVSAFSNTLHLGGGTVILGVRRVWTHQGPVYEVVGIDDPDKVSADLATQAASVFDKPVRPRIEPHSVDGKTVVVVRVSEASPNEKPIFFKKLGLPRGAFIRVGSTDQHCTDDDLQALYQARRGTSFDGSVLDDVSLDDIDPDAVAHYRNLRAKVNPDAEELGYTDEKLLEAINAARTVDGTLRPTVAGILLFGNRGVLRRVFPLMRVDYIRVPGKEWIRDPDARFQTVEARGPLLQLVHRMQDTVADDLPLGFALKEGEVQAERPGLPTRVLREAIVNALMHRCYMVQGAIQIIRYSNRIELRNPGYSLKAEERLGDPGSESRNPAIAAVFHDTNLAETKGSGIATMRRLMSDSGFAPPTFESDRVGNSFVARLLLHHFLSPDDLQWLRDLGVPGLSDEQRKGLIFVREVGAIDNAAYRQLNGVETLEASKELRRLRDLDLLEAKGKGSATYYVPGAKLYQRSLNPGELEPRVLQPSLFDQADSLFDQEQSLSNQDPLLIEQADQLSAQSEFLVDQVDEDLDPRYKLEDLPADLQKKVRAVGKRCRDKQILRCLIIELCRWHDMRTIELASLLKRGRRYLIHNFLGPLSREGVLEHTIPEMRSHPEQAYRLRTGTMLDL